MRLTRGLSPPLPCRTIIAVVVPPVTHRAVLQRPTVSKCLQYDGRPLLNVLSSVLSVAVGDAFGDSRTCLTIAPSASHCLLAPSGAPCGHIWQCVPRSKVCVCVCVCVYVCVCVHLAGLSPVVIVFTSSTVISTDLFLSFFG